MLKVQKIFFAVLGLQPQNYTKPIFECLKTLGVFFLFCCFNISLHAILCVFTSNLTENDRLVSNFIC